MKSILLVFLLMFSSSSFALDFFENCSFCQLDILDTFAKRNVNDLKQVSERNKTRVDLITANVTYGFLGIGVGRPQFFLNIKDGKIVDLNIEGEVGILGITSNLQRRITIDQLKEGTPLEFSMQGSEQPALRIRPSANFSDYGGEVTIEVWNGRSYSREIAHISASSGTYKAYKGSISRNNEVTGLDINVRGMSLAGMAVHNYRVRTRGGR